jgi:hypothetical protein
MLAGREVTPRAICVAQGCEELPARAFLRLSVAQSLSR